MPGGFAPRFAIEAGFLILLGVGAGIADLRTQVIVVLVAGGWVLVSLIELSIWRAEGRILRKRGRGTGCRGYCHDPCCREHAFHAPHGSSSPTIPQRKK